MKYCLILLFLFPLFLACNTGNKQKPQGSTFLYYPLVNVYYDIEQKQYFLFDSSQNKWVQKDTFGKEEQQLGRKVLITKATVPVYKDNDQHRLVYGTSLYSTKEDVRRKYIEDSLNSLPPPPKNTGSNSSDSQKTDKKKGFLGRLWDRIFKK